MEYSLSTGCNGVREGKEAEEESSISHLTGVKIMPWTEVGNMTELTTLPRENNRVGFEIQCLKVPTRHLRRDVLQKIGNYLQSKEEKHREVQIWESNFFEKSKTLEYHIHRSHGKNCGQQEASQAPLLSKLCAQEGITKMSELFLLNPNRDLETSVLLFQHLQPTNQSWHFK